MYDKQYWYNLLLYGRFSLGPFVISLNEDIVRIFHSRTDQTYRFPRDESYEKMRDLCRLLHYDMRYLLKNYKPKSYQYLAESERRFQESRPGKR